jgi:hypothetical protein
MTNPEMSPLVPCGMSKEAIKLLEFLTVVQKINAELPIYVSGWSERDVPLPFKVYPWEIKAECIPKGKGGKEFRSYSVRLTYLPFGISVYYYDKLFTWQNTNCCIDLLKQELNKRYELKTN